MTGRNLCSGADLWSDVKALGKSTVICIDRFFVVSFAFSISANRMAHFMFDMRSERWMFHRGDVLCASYIGLKLA